jgi:hypothetical protein
MSQEQNPPSEHYLNTCERAEDSSDDSSDESSDNDDSIYDDTSEEENPLPQWNLPNWQGNAAEAVGTICPCIKQVVEDGSIRGCAECDAYWDMPSLVGDADQIQCEGCYLLENGLGCENQLAHTCMEHF